MSKEYMQALEDLFGLVAFQGSFEKAQKYFDIIEEALQRLESIDNAEPSEALECLGKVYSRLPQWDLSRNVNQCNIIKQALLKAQKSLKAVQLIKTKSKKNYNLALVVDSGTYEQYCEQFKYFLDDYKEKAGAFEIGEEDKFSFEEYNLLREVFVYE